jgi:hypothetical protein
VRKIVIFYLYTKFRLSNPAVCYHRKQKSEAKICTDAICCYSFSKYGSWEEFQASPLSIATKNSMNRQKRAQEHDGDIKFCILESFPFQEDKALGSCLSLISVCPIASSIETFDRFSWYKNLIYLKFTPTPHFNFYCPSISNNKMADTYICVAVVALAVGLWRTKMVVRDSIYNVMLL